MCLTVCETVCVCESVSVCRASAQWGPGSRAGRAPSGPLRPHGGSGPPAVRGGALASSAAVPGQALRSPHELPAAGKWTEEGRVDASGLVTCALWTYSTVKKPLCALRPRGLGCDAPAPGGCGQ